MVEKEKEKWNNEKGEKKLKKNLVSGQKGVLASFYFELAFNYSLSA